MKWKPISARTTPARILPETNSPRNAVLFGPPGNSYVYFIYGNHFCFNVSCLGMQPQEEYCSAPLDPVDGIKEMAETERVAK